MKIKTIAIDDEPLALKLVADYVQKTPFLDLSATFDNPLDAIDFLTDNHVDLILIDIQMPDLTGTDFVRTLEKGPKVIFTTAYEKYALEGFKLDAVDYLLKPFSYDEFLKAVMKDRKLVELENHSAMPVQATEPFLFLKSDYKIRRIKFDNILYIEGLKDYIKVFTDNEPKPIMSLNTLKTIEQKLPEEQFMRIHRSYIVNLDKVETIERSRIVFGKNYIPVSDQYKEKFQEFVNRRFF